jgi:putative toxin-antitoxin system antitoxin component (TIGR02293 family)
MIFLSTADSPQTVLRSEAREQIWRYIAGESASLGVAEPEARVVAQGKLLALNNSSAYRIVKNGISSKAIGPLSDYLGVGKGQVVDYLDLDRTTVNRRAAKDQLLPIHSAEGVLRLLELDQMAGDTFASDDEAAAWLRRPHPMLDGESPLEAAKTSFGAQRAKDILVAVKYGGVV